MTIPSNIFLKPEQVTLKYIQTVSGFSNVDSIAHEPLSAGTKGALSAMGRIKLEGGGRDVPPSIVCKCLPQGFGERLFTDGTGMFYKEILFYRLLSVDLPMRVPKLYSAEFQSRKGFLLVEDLGLLPNPKFGDPWVPDDELILTKESAKSVMKGFAGMHGKFWESPRFQDDMSFFASHGRGLCGGTTLETKQNHFFYTQGWKKYQNWMNEVGVEIPQALRTLGELLMKQFPVLYKINFGEGPNTFIHGDAGQYNLMFYGEGEMVMFDWQTCQMGRGIYDVAFYLVLSSSTDFLTANEEELLTLYQSQLENAGVRYSKGDLMEHYKIALVTSWAVIVYVTGLLDDSWTEKIKIAARRTIAAVERLGAAELAIEQINQKGNVAPEPHQMDGRAAC